MHRLLLFSLSFFASVAMAQVSPSLSELDAILLPYSTYAEFRANPAAVEAYRVKATAYYGGPENFPADQFAKILAQFDQALTHFPDWAEAAWQHRPIREKLSARSAVGSYAYEFNPGGQARIANKIAGPAQTTAPVNIQNQFMDLRHQIEKAQTDGSRPTRRRERRSEMAEYFRAIKETPAFAKLRQQLVSFWLERTDTRDQLRLARGDVFLDRYLQFQRQPELFLPEFAPFKSELRFVTHTLPAVADLTDDHEIFRSKASDQVIDDASFEFEDVPRRFHSLFRGLFGHECVGGGGCEYEGWLTPTRWAIPLLNGGYEVHVRRNGRYTGYLSAIEMRRLRTKYFALEVLSFNMQNQMIELKESDGKPRLTQLSLLDWWLGQETLRLPSDVKGFVVGQADAINNTSGVEAIRRSQAWMRGKILDEASSFSPEDSGMAQEILSFPKPDLIAIDYLNGNLIAELGVDDSRQAVLLRPGRFDFNRMQNANWVNGHFTHSIDEEAKFWNTILWATPLTGEAQKARIQEANEIFSAFSAPGNPRASQAHSLLEKLSLSGVIALFEGQFPVIHSMDDLDSLVRWANYLNFYTYDLIDYFLTYHHNEIILAYTDTSHDRDVLATLTQNLPLKDQIRTLEQLLLPKIETIDAYLHINATTIGWPPEDRLAMDDFHMANLPRLKTLRHGISDWISFYGLLVKAESRRTILHLAFNQASNFGDITKLLGIASPRSEQAEMQAEIVELVTKNWATWMQKYTPTFPELKAAERSASNPNLRQLIKSQIGSQEVRLTVRCEYLFSRLTRAH